MLDVQEKMTNYQGYKGGQKVVEYYTATFTYRVKGQLYQGVDVLPGNTANGLFLKTILRSPDRKVNVQYQTKNPAKSIIDLK